MHAVKSSVSPTVLQQAISETESLKGHTITIFSPRESNKSIILSTYFLIADRVLKAVEKTMLNKINNPSGNLFFRINVNSSIEREKEEAVKHFKDDNSGKNLSLVF